MHPPVSGLGSQCISGNGEDYRGRIAITESGNTCQHWNTQFPHKHGWIPGRYPCKYAEPPHFSKYPRTWFSLSDPDKKTGGAVTLISYFLSFCHLSLLLFRPGSSFFFSALFFFSFFFLTNLILTYLCHLYLHSSSSHCSCKYLQLLH